MNDMKLVCSNANDPPQQFSSRHLIYSNLTRRIRKTVKKIKKIFFYLKNEKKERKKKKEKKKQTNSLAIQFSQSKTQRSWEYHSRLVQSAYYLMCSVNTYTSSVIFNSFPPSYVTPLPYFLFEANFTIIYVLHVHQSVCLSATHLLPDAQTIVLKFSVVAHMTTGSVGKNVVRARTTKLTFLFISNHKL